MMNCDDVVHFFVEVSLNPGTAPGRAAAIDWSTVFEVLLGAVVGFLSTGLTNWLVKKSQIRKLTKKISLELESSLNGLKLVTEDADNSYTLESPIWDVIPASSVLLDMPTEKYIKLITICMEIKKYNQEEKKDQTLLEHGYTLDAKDVFERRSRLIRIMEDNKF